MPNVRQFTLLRVGLLGICIGGAYLVARDSRQREPSVDPQLVAEFRAESPPHEKSAVKGTGWGTLVGTFRFRGEVPKPAAFDRRKDPLCTVPVEDESLLVDPTTHGLANVVIYALNPPEVHPDYEGGTGGEVTLTMNHCRFEPHVVGSTLQDKFVIRDIDSAPHSAAGHPGLGNVSYSELLAPRTGRVEYRHKIATHRPYDITCSIHPWMRAYHLIRPDPYFAITARDGTFKIERLPTGVKLKFQVWHERATSYTGQLRATSTWNADGRVELKIPKPGETVTFDVDVEPQAFK